MFTSKTWYKEIILLIVVPRSATFPIYVMFSDYLDYPRMIPGLIVILIFIALAIWRISRKKISVKEVLALILIDVPIHFGAFLLLPNYIAIFLEIGLLFLIISRIRARSLSRVTDQDLMTPD